MVKHAVMQLAPKKGQLEQNFSILAEHIKSLEANVDVVVLPESFPTAYFLQGGVRELALSLAELKTHLEQMFDSTGRANPLDIVIGFYEVDSGIYYNSAAYIELQRNKPCAVRHVHRKVFLPTYGVFDEERYISSGDGIKAFDTRFGRAAILICEDFWHSITGTIAALDGAQIIYVPSASPARGFEGIEPSNVTTWKSLAKAVSGEHGLYVVLASLVGIEAGKGLVGGSVIASPEGKLLGTAPVFEEAILLGDIDLERIAPVRYDNPMLADLESGMGILANDLLRVLKEPKQ